MPGEPVLSTVVDAYGGIVIKKAEDWRFNPKAFGDIVRVKLSFEVKARSSYT
jgi:hypothetical protein